MPPSTPPYPMRPSGPPPGSVPAPRRRAKPATGSGLTLGGWLLLLIGLLVVGSGMLRLVQVGTLHVHPYLFVVVPLFPIMVLVWIKDFPMWALVAMVVFAGVYAFSCTDHESHTFIVKMGSGMVTIVTVALLVRSRADFVAGVLGLMLAVGVLGVRGLSEDTAETALGVKAIDNANKNSYSLYALPAMLLAGHVVLRYKSVPWPLKALLVGGALASLAAIFESGNRSGYLGAVVVAIMLLWDALWQFKIKTIALGLLVVGGVTAALVFWMTHYGNTEILNRRLEQTAQGTESDTLRWNVFKACLQIGLENPIMGVSQGKLATVIGDHLPNNTSGEIMGPHNIFGAVIGGSGLICLAALIWIAISLWSWKPAAKYFPQGGSPAIAESRKLLHYMLILWAIRGMFNDEIISNPGFCIGLGLVIGLCAAAGRVAVRELGDAPRPSPGARRMLAPA